MLSLPKKFLLSGIAWGMMTMMGIHIWDNGFSFSDKSTGYWLGQVILWNVAGYFWGKTMYHWGLKKQKKAENNT